jgi:hypothetical protein
MEKWKNLIGVLLIVLVSIGLMVGCSSVKTLEVEEPIEEPKKEEKVEISGFGAIDALSDTNLTLEKMLTYAMQDEYLAHNEYTEILNMYGDIAPFNRIVLAEESHIDALKTVFQNQGIEIPEDTSSEHLIIPNSLKEALETGVQAEIDNIEMYTIFLNQEIPEDVKTVFKSLKTASESHLKAFQNNLEAETK